MLIYSITNKVNNKKYIGQTIKSCVKNRYSGTIKNTHNSYLKNSINKYGIENFEIEIILYCKDRESLNYWEMYYINKYKTYDTYFGYNLKLGGSKSSVSDECKKIISIRTKQAMNKPEVREKTIKGLREYHSKPENRLKNSFTQLEYIKNHPEKRQKHKVITKERIKNNPEYLEKLWNGHKQFYSNPDNVLKDSQRKKQYYIDNPLASKKHSEFMKELLSSQEVRLNLSIKKGGKPFDVFNKETFEYIGTWIDQHQCSRELNLQVGHLNSCLKRKRPFHKEYIFIYQDFPEYIIDIVKDLESPKKSSKLFGIYKNNILIETFQNQRECSRKYDLDFKQINSCLFGKRKTEHKGYTFKYIEEDNESICK